MLDVVITLKSLIDGVLETEVEGADYTLEELTQAVAIAISHIIKDEYPYSNDISKMVIDIFTETLLEKVEEKSELIH